jgi:outer membrane biosynthesis protein TonB
MIKSLRTIAVVLCCAQVAAVSLRAEQIEENFQPYVISKPDPVMPMVAVRQGWHGHIVCVLTINPKNGIVDEVKVVRHTGNPKLDAIMVMTFFNWRFRPGTISKTKIQYDIGTLGRGRDLH